MCQKLCPAQRPCLCLVLAPVCTTPEECKQASKFVSRLLQAKDPLTRRRDDRRLIDQTKRTTIDAIKFTLCLIVVIKTVFVSSSISTHFLFLLLLIFQPCVLLSPPLSPSWPSNYRPLARLSLLTDRPFCRRPLCLTTLKALPKVRVILPVSFVFK